MLLNKRISIKYFLSTIKFDLLMIAIYAIAIGYLDNYSFFRNQTIPLALTAVVGTAVSLLLAFRTSQSYDRWWEARIVWGAIVNDSRTLMRQVITFYDGPDKAAFVKDFGYRQIFWCYALASTLRRTKLPPDCQEYVDSLNLKDDNIPNGMLSEHSRMIRQPFIEGNINQFQQIQLDNTIVKLCDAMGKCERIKNTIFPTSYSTLIHFLIYFIVTILPFGIDDNHIVLEIVLCIAIPSVFIAIEKTSILMQDPFENLPLDTPMTSISRTIEKNIKQMIEEPVAKQEVVEDSYFVL